MDDKDRQILNILQKDSSLTNIELAERVNLSPSACLRRVKQLEDSGTIERYVAILSKEKAHKTAMAFVFIRVERQNLDVFQAFEKAVGEIPEVMECYLMAGDSDYMLKLVYKDAKDFERIYFKQILSLPGVLGTESRPTLRTVYSSTAIELK